MNGENLNPASTAEGMEKNVGVDYQQAGNIRLAYRFLEEALQKVRAKYDATGEGEVRDMLEGILVDFISPASVLSHVLYGYAYADGDKDSMDNMLEHQSELNRLDPRTPSQPIQSEERHM